MMKGYKPKTIETGNVKNESFIELGMKQCNKNDCGQKGCKKCDL